MITSLIYDHADRRRSYELLSEAFAIDKTAAPFHAATQPIGLSRSTNLHP
jgi:hypothetical protein